MTVQRYQPDIECIDPTGSAPVEESCQAVLKDMPAGLEPLKFGRRGATGTDTALSSTSSIESRPARIWRAIHRRHTFCPIQIGPKMMLTQFERLAGIFGQELGRGAFTYHVHWFSDIFILFLRFCSNINQAIYLVVAPR